MVFVLVFFLLDATACFAQIWRLAGAAPKWTMIFTNHLTKAKEDRKVKEGNLGVIGNSFCCGIHNVRESCK
jgi:hypothetical protein